MKKILTITTGLVLLSITSFSQVTLGVRAGANFQNINGKDFNGNKLDNGISTGFSAGINAELPIGVDFYLQPGVLYTQKGAELRNYQYMGQTWDGKVKLNYVEIPLNFVYKPQLGTGRWMVGFGPYVAFGIGGTVDLADPQGAYDVKFSKDADAGELNETPFVYRPIDAGANVFAGYEFANKLSIQLNTQLGLTKINSTVNGSNAGEESHKNTGFGLSLGYRF